MRLEGLSEEKVEGLLPDGLVFLGYRGSHSHGTYVPPSDPSGVDDVDLLGVFVAPVEHYLDSQGRTRSRSGRATTTACSTSGRSSSRCS